MRAKANIPLCKIVDRTGRFYDDRIEVQLACGSTKWVSTSTTYRARCRACARKRAQQLAAFFRVALAWLW